MEAFQFQKQDHNQPNQFAKLGVLHSDLRAQLQVQSDLLAQIALIIIFSQVFFNEMLK